MKSNEIEMISSGARTYASTTKLKTNQSNDFSKLVKGSKEPEKKKSKPLDHVIKNKKVTKQKPKNVVKKDTTEDVKAKVESLEDEIKSVAKELDVDESLLMETLFSYMISGDTADLLKLLGVNQEENLEATLLTDSALTQNLTMLKDLAASLKEVVESLQIVPKESDEIFKTDSNVKGILDQFMTGNDDLLNVKIEGKSESQNSQLHEGRESKEKESTSNQSKTSSEQTPFVISRLNTIESMQARMNIQEMKQADQVTKIQIIKQVVEQISISKMDEMTTMTVKLKPDHLGNLLFSVTNQKGIMTANFVAENAAVKEAIEANLFQLKEAFEAGGIDVEHIEVSVADNQYFEQREQQQQESKKKSGSKRIEHLMNQTEIGNEDDEKETVSLQNTMVDYSV